MVHSILKRFSLPVFIVFILTSCGLPTQIVLDKPTVLANIDLNDYTAGFSTLSSSYVRGYVLYYKVYAQGMDTELINSDSEKIDENISSTGNTLLNNLGFHPMYRYYDNQFVANDLLENYNPGSSTILLDFTDPAKFHIKVNGTVLSDGNGEFILGRDQDKPEGEGLGKKSFTDSYLLTDKDLEALFSRLSSNGEELTIAEIGIAVYAIGFDPSIGYTEIYSLPVFLGTVHYNSPDLN